MSENVKTTRERISKQTLKANLASKRGENKKHSTRFLNEEAKIADKIKQALPLEEALGLVKQTASTKFDSSVELHIHLTPKKGKKGVEDELMRGMLHLPQGLGKDRKVVILNEEIIDELAKTQNVNFDVALATPALMPKLGRVAKLLGTRGKMPNPKAGTVTENPEQVKAEIEAGRVEYRQDATRNIHQMIGKSSWDIEKLAENARAVMKTFPKNRVMKATITSTMGPSISVIAE